ncbi:MAG: TIGR02453 family protein, partial [Chloroflexi bacterium]|nr:TIGR02453 family protein [Chloroflexota bacterium]
MVFSEELIDFLVGLSANNSREWFNERKDVYESVLREPALEYIREVGGPLADISPHVRASDRKRGGSLMRIYRDVRFSRDKSPYKTNVGIQFRHESGKDVHAPGYYVHISIEECFIGAGSWMPDRDALLAYRRAVSEHPSEWLALKQITESDEWN